MPSKNLQTVVRLSDTGRRLLAALVHHYTTTSDTGRPATNVEVIERALRHLARREKIPKKKQADPLDRC